MTLFKLSLKNIKKSIKDYAIYFFTLILGIAIFYVFNAIEKQSVMLEVTKSTKDIIQLMVTLLSGVSVFISIVLGFLIVYANGFLMKRRKKEFGIYMILGMGKGRISMILFFETFLIGILSLSVGILLGIGLSQLMSVLVAYMFEADMKSFIFVVSKQAIEKTIVYFLIMYLLVMIFNTFSVSRCKLITLLQSSRKNETVKIKNTWLCLLVFVVAVLLLGRQYYLVGYQANTLNDTKEIMSVIISGIVATFLIFWSVSGFILRIVLSMKHMYYKGLNSFILREINSKINTAVASISVICLMLFLSICIFGGAFGMNYSLNQAMKTLVPMDLQINKIVYCVESDEKNSMGENYTQEEVELSNLTAKESLATAGFDIEKELKDDFEVTYYYEPDFTMGDSFGTILPDVLEEHPYFLVSGKQALLKQSDYNRVARTYGFDEIVLKENEYAVSCNMDDLTEYRNRALQAGMEITLSGGTYYPSRKNCLDGFVEMSLSKSNFGLFVFPDKALTDSRPLRNFYMADYKTEDEEQREALSEMIEKLGETEYLSRDMALILTKQAIYSSSVGLGSMMIFIGLYLGVIFLLASAAILALKQLADCSDNRERYEILRKIGVDDKMINRSILIQTAVFFFIPFLLALLHSVFGLRFINYILLAFKQENALYSIIMTTVLLVGIYGGYFLLTYLCSKNIIKES